VAQLAALARALAAAIPNQEAFADELSAVPGDEIQPEDVEAAADRMGVLSTFNELLADYNLTAESVSSLILQQAVLAWALLQRLADALDLPVDEVRARVWAELAAQNEGLEPPDLG
jgi:hypothetical protein